MKKNLNRLLLLPVSAIAINQAQAMNSDFDNQEAQNTNTIENYTRDTQYRFNSSDYQGTTDENEINYNDNNYNNGYETTTEQMDAFNNNTNNINSGSVDMNFSILQDQIYNYIKDNPVLTYAAAIHRGSINDFMQHNNRINLSDLTQMVMDKYNGRLEQGTKAINEAVLKGIFQYMTVGEVLEEGGLHDTSSIIQNVLAIAAADKKAIVPSLLRTNLNSFGTLLHTELPKNESIGDSNEDRLAYALSFLTTQYLSLQGQKGFVEPPAESLTKVKEVLKKHSISLKIDGIVLYLEQKDENNDMEKKNALLNELKEVLGDTCYTSIKKDLFNALYSEDELTSMQDKLNESDSPVTEEVLNSAITFYKTITKQEKLERGLDSLDKLFKNSDNNLKTEFLKDMQKGKRTEIKDSNDDNDDDNIKNEDNQNNFIPDSNNDKLNLKLSQKNMNKSMESMDNIKVELKEQKNETNAQNKNNLNSSKRYNNPLSSVQNLPTNEVMLQSNSILQKINTNMYQLVASLEQQNGLNAYWNRTTLLKLQNDIKSLNLGIQHINTQRNNNTNRALQAVQNTTYDRMMNAYKILSGLKDQSSQFEQELNGIRNNQLLLGNANDVLRMRATALDTTQQKLKTLLSERNTALNKVYSVPLSGLGQNQYISLVSRLKSIDIAISETAKNGNEIIAQLENKNQIGGMSNNLKYNSGYGNSGTTYGNMTSNRKKLY